MRLLVTGGTGYIGSHTVVELINSGHDVIIIDNLSNSSTITLQRIEAITGKSPIFIEGDICDVQALRLIFEQYDIDSVVHFAGLKAVGESNEIPLSYYHNNVSGSITLFQVMAEFGCKNLVFSSSATVYGENNEAPLLESMPVSATNPYGQTKLMIEGVLRDLSSSDPHWHIMLLRYFNPIGAHESGTIGEDPSNIPNNLVPYVAQVAAGKLAELNVFGNDYDTIDGTGVRDYIHVVDLAIGHCKAIDGLANLSGCRAVNLGTGKGTSVLELVNKFAEISQCAIPFKIAPRRAGDLAIAYADPSLAEQILGWQAKFDLERMIIDTWRWQTKNPNGYVK
ncbi:MAG: UDP-glucose 4-epimerase GalE [Psychrosphaera sp.]|nr:UDP-glucose 4-epimerase GalE [Psychrosphaera sp.]